MLTEYKLSEAILVYSAFNGYYGNSMYLQRHKVMEQDGRSMLLEGVPYTLEDLTALCRQLLPGLVSDSLRFSDAGVLASSGSAMGPDVWWIPGSVKHIFFEKLDAKSGNAPWPSLVFVAHGGHLKAHAVKGTKRPGLKTRLYVAPFPNMHGSEVCLGNSSLPARSFDYGGWEKAFFESSFSEVQEENRVKTGSLTEFWDGLVKSGASRFPDSQLVPSRSCKTVSDLLSDLRRRMINGY